MQYFIQQEKKMQNYNHKNSDKISFFLEQSTKETHREKFVKIL